MEQKKEETEDDVSFAINSSVSDRFCRLLSIAAPSVGVSFYS